MRTMQLTLIALSVFIGSIYGAAVEEFQFECSSHSDCGEGSCCLITMNRYSRPRCEKRLKEGTSCIPYLPTGQNMTFEYPDGTEFFVKEVVYHMCPCSEGFTCPKNTVNPVCIGEFKDSASRQ